MARAGNRQSSIYLGKDGHWHGRVTVGRKDDGSLDRRHVMSKSKGTVVAKVRALERLRDEARVPRAGRAWTVEKWLLHWLEEIARPTIRESSYQAYRTAVTKHLLPTIGASDAGPPRSGEHRGGLPTNDRRRRKAGHRPSGASHLADRAWRGRASRSHRPQPRPTGPASPDPARPRRAVHPRGGQVAAGRCEGARNGARWAIALALGLRQGEALALRWDDVDLERKSLRVRATRLRPVYEHGCDGDCGKTAGYCPQRRPTNGITGATKSAAGNRVVGLPDELVTLLKDHRRQQLKERIHAGSLWKRAAGSSPLWSGDRSPPTATTTSGGHSSSAPGCATPASRRPTHRGDRAARPRCPRTDRHVDHGLVEHLHGGEVPARHRPDPAGGGPPSGWPALW